MKKMVSRPCEETCAGYKQIGIDACQGCTGKQSDYNEKEVLFGPTDVERRTKQLELNQRVLISKFDELHAILCPKQMGTWQQRIEQVIVAVRELTTST